MIYKLVQKHCSDIAIKPYGLQKKSLAIKRSCVDNEFILWRCKHVSCREGVFFNLRHYQCCYKYPLKASVLSCITFSYLFWMVPMIHIENYQIMRCQQTNRGHIPHFILNLTLPLLTLNFRIRLRSRKWRIWVQKK